MEDRIFVNGKWYVAEKSEQPLVKTVDWMISKLQELSKAGYGNREMTIDGWNGYNYDTISDVQITADGRVHIS